MPYPIVTKKAKARSRTAKGRSLKRVVRPPWRLGQCLRHKATGDMGVVTAIDREIYWLTPLATAYLIYPEGYEGWEAV